MVINDIKQKLNKYFLLLKNKKWTKKNIVAVLFFTLLIIFLFVFFNGNKDGVDYIKINEQDYVEKIVAVGQLGMDNQTTVVSQVSGTIGYVGAEAGQTVSACLMHNKSVTKCNQKL